ncbi:MAG: MBL fold metallo-hydrolase [Deltaproteobacteria bacterium]|nr:MBL fold metallo-hydrolase [Deltaproteobacteria bacterium]MBI3078132.1 MBL fold metallo-hydrolase [Deltaproteobacteria bacterium]
MVVEYTNGITVRGIDLWLDPRTRKDLAVVSHAHMDHVARHGAIIASPGTARLCAHRLGEVRTQVLRFGEPAAAGRGRITLLPAGHMLGSAQILLELDGRSLLYSGDFKVRPGETAEPLEVRHADILVMECTYGRPQYLFPPRDEVLEGIGRFIRRSFAAGAVPILLVYALGKGQEVAKLLGDRGYRVALHRSIYEGVRVYEEFGVKFTGYERYDGQRLDDTVLLAPPGAERSLLLRAIPRKRRALLTGWALDGRPKGGIEAAFPLSDHADFRDLLWYVEQVRPKLVYTLHGFDEEFARQLLRRGVRARPLRARTQLLLFHDLT